MTSPTGPVVLMDTGDNIGGGSAGDGTFILQELLKQKAQGCVVVISDADANKAAFGAGVGGAFDQQVGGKTDRIHGPPVRVTGRVRSLHSGQYVEPEVRHGGGRYRDMGPTAVIEVQGSTRDVLNLLLLTDSPSSPNSLHQLISNGVYPERQRILVVKGDDGATGGIRADCRENRRGELGRRHRRDPAHFTFKQVRSGLFGLRE